MTTRKSDLVASVESWHRDTKQLGQVATPEPVAALMAKWVMSAKPRTVLDPAAGLGGLLAACRQIDRQAALVGVERDTETLLLAKTTAPRGTKLVLADYLRCDVGLFDGIIANPPYVKAHRLDYSENDWRYFEERLSTPLDRLTNLYALFLLKIWEDLSPRGRAAIIIPAEFLNANFGVEIKERLLRAIRPSGIVIFEPSLNVFRDALTTSAIVLFDKVYRPSTSIWARMAESLDDAEQFVDGLLADSIPTASSGLIDLSALNPRDKWLNLVLSHAAGKKPISFAKSVGDYFYCRRGIATGANDFFCLSRNEIRAHHLSEAHFAPCITKATDADGLVFTRDKFDGLANRDRKCFLLNPSQLDPDLNRYLELGAQQGIPKRHLPRHRPIWYLPENRAVADIWAAVFSRESAKFILNISGAKNLTCFHGLYAKPGSETLAPLMTLFLNSSLGREAFSQVNRFYGNGLNKLEPKDVEAMPCPEMPKITLTEANELVDKLVELDTAAPNERTTLIDDFLRRRFDFSELGYR